MKSGRRRQELEAAFAESAEMDEGWSLRSQSVRADIDLIRLEMSRLKSLWAKFGSTHDQAPKCVLAPPSMLERMLRDRGADGSVIVDDRMTILDLEKKLAGREIEGLDKLLFHDEREPLFDAYGVNDGLEEAQSPVVPLRNGGRITIETTRALTAIDVDMGGSGGKQRSDDAVFAMNNAAAQAIPRQLRLRNIAGLIVVDFIGMRRKDHRQKLVERFKREFRLASVSVDVLGMTAAGLIEVTRRRDGLSLVELMLQPKSTEILLSVESLACQVLRDLMRTQGAGGYRLIASSRVVRVLSGPFKAAFDETVRRLGGALTMLE
ncbi:MAG: ribonuclease E/G, partial [Pseudomonadota bacterium]|nr:ribonuclease E/G [Pseudomonadota bacterium]